MGPLDGATIDVTIECRGQRLRARVTRRSAEQLSLKPGLAVFAIINAVALDPVWPRLVKPGADAGPPS
jgi:molybdate transport system ATP-binding protein